MLGAGDFAVSWSAFPRLALQGLPAWLLGSLIVGFVLGMAVFWLTLLVMAPLRRHAAAAGEPA
jgi:hypothetical protein